MPGMFHRGRIHAFLKRSHDRGKFFNAKTAIENFRNKEEFNFEKVEVFLKHAGQEVKKGVNVLYDPTQQESFCFTSQEYWEMKAIHEANLQT